MEGNSRFDHEAHGASKVWLTCRLLVYQISRGKTPTSTITPRPIGGGRSRWATPPSGQISILQVDWTPFRHGYPKPMAHAAFGAGHRVPKHQWVDSGSAHWMKRLPCDPAPAGAAERFASAIGRDFNPIARSARSASRARALIRSTCSDCTRRC